MRYLLGALLLLAVASCTQSEPAPPAEAVHKGPFEAGPVAAPAEGALLGAWVRPDSYSQPGRLAAVAEYEAHLGRRLDIVHSYRRLHEKVGTRSDLHFIQQATLMLSWAGASSAETLSGRIDDEIRRHARQVRDLGKPVLIRIRWEMDRPNLAASVGSPALYQEMWRYVRRIFAEEGARNVSWVFCPTADGFAEGRAAAFYPGDDSVDWVCVDVYAGSRLRPMSKLLAPFLKWAAARPKPIMIGEYGVARSHSSRERSDWLRGAAAVFQANPQIKAVLYYESNPDGRPASGEFALADDALAMSAFVEAARHPHFNPIR